ncbi:hypothetical protein [Shewanella donghaensis]|uniref:hypothetical protein n=1 Tax=Shewanella donghaensis TaxID=238836 RepID=UPI001181E5E9|nr:hypothetical protein [Shewanella donghaensis]
MSLVNSLGISPSNIKALTDQTNSESGISSQSAFSSVLEGVISGNNIVSSSVTAISNLNMTSSDDFSDNFKSSFLSETGLDDISILPLSISDDIITQMQQELLSSLQSSMVNPPSIAPVSSVSNILDTSTVSSIEDLSKSANLSSNGEIPIIDTLSAPVIESNVDLNDFLNPVNLVNNVPIFSDLYQIATDKNIKAASSLATSMLMPNSLGAQAVGIGVNYLANSDSVKELAASAGELLSDDES